MLSKQWRSTESVDLDKYNNNLVFFLFFFVFSPWFCPFLQLLYVRSSDFCCCYFCFEKNKYTGFSFFFLEKDVMFLQGLLLTMTVFSSFCMQTLYRKYDE